MGSGAYTEQGFTRSSLGTARQPGACPGYRGSEQNAIESHIGQSPWSKPRPPWLRAEGPSATQLLGWGGDPSHSGHPHLCSPQPALVHQGRRPEAILCLPSFSSHLAPRSSSSGGDSLADPSLIREAQGSSCRVSGEQSSVPWNPCRVFLLWALVAQLTARPGPWTLPGHLRE